MARLIPMRDRDGWPMPPPRERSRWRRYFFHGRLSFTGRLRYYGGTLYRRVRDE